VSRTFEMTHIGSSENLLLGYQITQCNSPEECTVDGCCQ
jgi:hypothetical protein